VPVRSQDEIGELSKAFNLMVEDLRRQQDQVIALEKMAAWREVARVLAHEIKNPLTPIQLMVQQIQDGVEAETGEDAQAIRECTDIINEEIEKLRSLVREFSDFARAAELHRRPAQLNELVADVAQLYPQQNLATTLAPGLPLANLDWDAMRRVLINLVENALQSAPQVSVHLQTLFGPDEQFVELRVADTGEGIPPEHVERIFEPYFSTKKTGTGLGLAIVKRIIVEHNGTIEVASERAEGSTFTLRLPRADSGRA